jgi:hypothetical protein
MYSTNRIQKSSSQHSLGKDNKYCKSITFTKAKTLWYTRSYWRTNYKARNFITCINDLMLYAWRLVGQEVQSGLGTPRVHIKYLWKISRWEIFWKTIRNYVDWDIVVGIITRYELEDPEIESRWRRTNPGGEEIFRTRPHLPSVHPAPYTMGAGSLPGGEALNTHPI